jgi:uncharacterized membrane protein
MSLFEVFQHKNMLHAAAVHLPIVLAMIGVPMVMLSLIFRQVHLLRVLTLAVYLLMAATAYYAEHTGEGARSLVSGSLGTEIWSLIDRHEEMAARVKFAALATTVLLLLALIPQRKVQIGISIVTFLSSLAGMYLVTLTAHDGGTLVYHHGVGTPFRETMTPGIAPTFPSPVVAQPAPVATLPEPAAPVLQEAPVMAAPASAATPVEEATIDAAPVEAPIEVAPETVPVEAVPGEAEMPAPVEASALSLSVVTPEQQVNTDVLPVAAEVLSNPGVIPVSDVLNNPAWIPVREIDLAAAKEIVFSRDVWPIIESECFDCHSAPEPDGAYEMGTREALLKRGEKAGAGVIPGDPDNSAIIHYIRGIMQPQMPKKAPPLSEDQVHLLRSWIAAGAVVDAEPGA